MFYHSIKENKNKLMKNSIAFLLMILFAFITGLYCSWWVFALPVFVIAAFLLDKPFASFLTGFLAIFVLWAGLAAFINQNNDGLLAQKVAHLLPLKGSATALILITGLIGALVGGSAALSGTFLGRILQKEK